MTITLKLSPQIEAFLQAEADRKGTTIEAAATYELALRHAQEQAQAELNGPMHPLKESMEEFLRKHNIPDLAQLSEEERRAYAEAAIARMTKQQRDELFEPESASYFTQEQSK